MTRNNVCKFKLEFDTVENYNLKQKTEVKTLALCMATVCISYRDFNTNIFSFVYT